MKVIRKIIHFLDRLLNSVIAVSAAIMLLFAGYSLWDSTQVLKEADAKEYEIYRPEEGKFSFEELQKINPEVIAWLTIPGTHVDYPVAQGTDNMKYVNTNAEGEFALSGSLFLDSMNSPDFTDANSILYGHHMDKDAMFGELYRYQDADFFDVHATGKLYYDNTWHVLQFFAFLSVDSHDNVVYDTTIQFPEEFEMYQNYIKQNAVQYREMNQNPDDHYIILSTCTSASVDERHVLVGKLMKGEES